MTEADGARRPKVPFPAGRAGTEFTQGVADHIQRLVEANMTRFIPPENVLRYRHGEGWSIERADASADVGRFKTVDVVRSVHDEDFVNNDLGKLLEIFQEYVREFTQKNEKMVVETTVAAAESAGNEVSGSGSWVEAFLESLKKIKLSADRHVPVPWVFLSARGMKHFGTTKEVEVNYDEFITEVQSRGHMGSREEAENAARATLQTLSERLAGQEPQNLASQLPPELAEHMSDEGTAEPFSLEEFFRRVSEKNPGVDEPQAVYHARVVMEVVSDAVTGGEMDDVRSQLPEEYVPLFEAGSQGEMDT